jgi:hypothetical protein
MGWLQPSRYLTDVRSQMHMVGAEDCKRGMIPCKSRIVRLTLRNKKVLAMLGLITSVVTVAARKHSPLPGVKIQRLHVVKRS